MDGPYTLRLGVTNQGVAIRDFTDLNGTFVNTGRQFLQGFDYLYDAAGGYVGYAWTGRASSMYGSVARMPVTAALRAGSAERDPRIACAISGFRRLPSFTGAVFTSAFLGAASPGSYVPGAFLVEPAFVPPLMRFPMDARCWLIRPVMGAVMRENSRLSWAERMAALACSSAACAERCCCTR